MAASSGMPHWKMDYKSGKGYPRDISENRKRGTGGRLPGGGFDLQPLFWNSVFCFGFAVPACSMGWAGPGNLLVLPASGNQVFEGREYEGIRQSEKGTLQEARYAVSMIVGRDTQCLTEEGVTKAAVETVAENTSDGVIAPMVCMAVGGVPLMFLYKGINTMDSMLGYKNDKYLYFGRCAAKLDDVVNYIPARISGWLMAAATAFVGMDTKNAVKIYRRDRRNHASPNSAQTEAAMAGALDVQLAGNAYYFGKLYEKPTIGDALRPIEPEDIRRANRLLYGTAVLGAVLCTGLRLAILIIV